MTFAHLKLLRPLNGTIAAGATLLGYLMVHPQGRFEEGRAIFFACLSVFLIAGFGNAHNDLRDIGTDSASKPDRPIPSGLISKSGAARSAYLVLAFGLAAASLVSVKHLLAALLAAGILWIYNVRLKGTVLIGNAAVAALTASALLYGAMVAAPPWKNILGAVVPALFAFWINFVREIVKDGEDWEGDGQNGIRTLAVVRGTAFAANMSSLLILIFIPLTWLPYVFQVYGRTYLWAVIAAVDIPLLMIIFQFVKRPVQQNTFHWVSRGLKWIMGAGMAALYFGK